MKREDLVVLIDKVVGSRGVIRASVWWVKRLFNQLLEYLENFATKEADTALSNAKRHTNTAIAEIKYDSSMSSSSEKAVQNKVVKAYIDDKTAIDSSMSSTSTKAVQNKVVKAYADEVKNMVLQLMGDSIPYMAVVAEDERVTISWSGKACECRIDNGDWLTFYGNSSKSINKGQKICFRGQLDPGGDIGIGTFQFSGKARVEGNPMSLIHGDFFMGKNSLSSYSFMYLFKDNTGLTYVDPDFLPFTGINSYCYKGMFSGCTSLVNAPELPAYGLYYNCYEEMFSGCTSLVTAPDLHASSHYSDCYKYMFRGCTSLVNAPTLSSYSPKQNSHYGMFQDCTSLVNAPELPATTLAESCYAYMFSGCTSLVNAPELPAWSLKTRCYEAMFDGCTSLVIAPELTSDLLSDGTYCYARMFRGCSSLNYIKMIATHWGANDIEDWTEGVAQNGTLVVATTNYDYSPENYGLPSGWSIVPNTDDCICVEALEDGLTFSASGSSSSYSVKGRTSGWQSLGSGTESIAINAGEKMYIKSALRPFYNDGKFTISKKFNLSGNIVGAISNDRNGAQRIFQGTAVVDASRLILPELDFAESSAYRELFRGCQYLVNPPKLTNTRLMEYHYLGMFRGCTSLVNAPELPATTLASRCYSEMFYGCTSLVNAPELPATTLAEYCYENMFTSCTSLANAPELLATTLAKYCYSYMFTSCTSLVNAPELPATALAEECYAGMFRGCTSLVNAPELPATTLAAGCYRYMYKNCTSLANVPDFAAVNLARGCCEYMFDHCTSLVNAPELPATTLAEECYYFMFESCTSLVRAPELLAATLASKCYRGMFARCSSLNYIKMLATDISAENCLNYWCIDVSKDGVFVKAVGIDIANGESGIPSGWTVEEVAV